MDPQKLIDRSQNGLIGSKIPLVPSVNIDRSQSRLIFNYGYFKLTYYGGFHKWGTPRWMVFFRENPLKMDDNSGYIHGNLYIPSISLIFQHPTPPFCQGRGTRLPHGHPGSSSCRGPRRRGPPLCRHDRRGRRPATSRLGGFHRFIDWSTPIYGGCTCETNVTFKKNLQTNRKDGKNRRSCSHFTVASFLRLPKMTAIYDLINSTTEWSKSNWCWTTACVEMRFKGMASNRTTQEATKTPVFEDQPIFVWQTNVEQLAKQT